MALASIETTLELWAGSLRATKERLRPLFGSKSTAASAEAFIDGLLGSEPRKTGWMRAEAAGDKGPWLRFSRRRGGRARARARTGLRAADDLSRPGRSNHIAAGHDPLRGSGRATPIHAGLPGDRGRRESHRDCRRAVGGIEAALDQPSGVLSQAQRVEIAHWIAEASASGPRWRANRAKNEVFRRYGVEISLHVAASSAWSRTLALRQGRHRQAPHGRPGGRKLEGHRLHG
jgi:hypothetical protein